MSGISVRFSALRVVVLFQLVVLILCETSIGKKNTHLDAVNGNHVDAVPETKQHRREVEIVKPHPKTKQSTADLANKRQARGGKGVAATHQSHDIQGEELSQADLSEAVVVVPEDSGLLYMMLGEWTDFWVVRLTLNVLGYASVIVPAYLVIQYMKRTKYNERAGPGCFPNTLKLCVFGKDDKPSVEEGPISSSPEPEKTFLQNCALLCLCFCGLQGSYLTWGVLQERIMTFEYGDGEYFTNSQFLVFMNRILALVIALIVISVRRQPKHTAPLFKYSYCSFSNIMSSWFQYEALKFISFPTQVLAKASKIIPVMLMGKLVSQKTYEYYEYVTALMISLGVGMFLLTSRDVARDDDKSTTYSGIILLVGYMVFDSFTSNWQGALFKQHKMSSIQMMAGVNLFSCLFTVTSLLEQGGFLESLTFMMKYSTFVFHIVLLSICSATGQLFIFYTISVFGPVTFIIIMTVRQGLAILLSCIIYSHPVTVAGLLGILLVFLALFLRIYAGHRKKALKSTTSSSTKV